VARVVCAPAILSAMLPLASATGYAAIGGAVAFAGAFAWYLLRMESYTAREEEAEQQAAEQRDAEQTRATAAAPAPASADDHGPAFEVAHDREADVG